MKVIDIIDQMTRVLKTRCFYEGTIYRWAKPKNKGYCSYVVEDITLKKIRDNLVKAVKEEAICFEVVLLEDGTVMACCEEKNEALSYIKREGYTLGKDCYLRKCVEVGG